MDQALDGFNAARQRLDGAASNLARVNIPAARALRVHQASGPGGQGLRAGNQLTYQPIEPAREMVELIQAEQAVQANARFIKVGTETYKSLIDILA